MAKIYKSNCGTRQLSSEYLLFVSIMLLGIVNVYLCFERSYAVKQTVFSLLALAVVYIMSKMKNYFALKGVAFISYALIIILSVLLVITKSGSGYLLFDVYAIDMISLTNLSVVPISVIIATCFKKHTASQQIMYYICLALPLLLINAVTAAKAVIPAITAITVMIVLQKIRSMKVKANQLAALTIMLLALIIVTALIVTLLLLWLAPKTPLSTTSDVNLLGKQYIRYSVSKCGVFFPTCVILIGIYFYSYMTVKACFVKGNAAFSITFSASLTMLLNLIMSVCSELAFGINKNFEIPFFSLSNSSLYISACMLGIILTSFKNDAGYNEKLDLREILAWFERKRWYMAKKHDVFISYRRDGGIDLAMHINDKLKLHHKRKPFMDIEDMRAGKFNEQLYERIDECKNFVLVLSENSLDRCVNEDDWVKKEVLYAMSKGKNIIPVKTQGFKFPDNLPQELRALHYYQDVKASNEMFDVIIDKLNKMLI